MDDQNSEGSQLVSVDPSLLEWAEYWYPISWKGVLAGGVITAIGACATIAFLLLQWRTTSIREEQSDWRTSILETQALQAKADLGKAQVDLGAAQADIERSKAEIARANEGTANANKQIAELSTQSEQLRKDTAEANSKAAKANERIAELTVQAEDARKETAQAKLELQQLRFPRRLDSDKLKAEIKEISPQFFEVLYDQSSADGSSLAFEIFVCLASIGWKTDQKLPAPLTPQQGPLNLRDVYQLLPLMQQVGGSSWGVSVVTKGPIVDDPKAVENILTMALLHSVSSPVQLVGHGKDETMPEGKIRVIVGPKLP